MIMGDASSLRIHARKIVGFAQCRGHRFIKRGWSEERFFARL
jgi:hypothetical protein